MQRNGSDRYSLKTIAEKRSIQLVGIDLRVEEIAAFGFPFKYIIYLGYSFVVGWLFYICFYSGFINGESWTLFLSIGLTIGVVVIAAPLIHLGIVIIVETLALRNEHMATKALGEMHKNGSKTALLQCGSLHANGICAALRKKGAQCEVIDKAPLEILGVKIKI
jgi:hypothetical protein